MEFQKDKLLDFRELFKEVQPKIANFPGCLHVEMCTDPTFENVFYTFSKWENDEHLQAYRESKLFEETWVRTKALFSGKPLAYSLLQDS